MTFFKRFFTFAFIYSIATSLILGGGLLPSARAKEAASTPPKRKVLFIGIDGMRADAMEAAKTPNMAKLIAEGCYSRNAQGEDLTFSGPNWSSITHGIHRDKHNVTTNDYRNSNLAVYPNFLSRLEKHNPQWLTARYVTWDMIHIHQPSDADINEFRAYNANGDVAMTQAAVKLIQEKDPAAIYVYIGNVDTAGHAYGFGPYEPKYLQAIEEADSLVGQMLDAIAARPLVKNKSEEWLVVITSDHGGAMTKGHSGNSPEQRRLPFIVHGPGVVQGTPFPAPRNLSVSKTILHFMGVPIPAVLDGTVVGFTKTSRPEVKLGKNAIYNGDAEYDRGFANTKFDQYVSGWNDPGPHQIGVILYHLKASPKTADHPREKFGKNLFFGGKTKFGLMTQQIDISHLRTQVHLGKMPYTLSADLGGYKNQKNRMTLSLRFLDKKGRPVSRVMLPAVSVKDRNGKTGILHRVLSGRVPAETYTIQVELLSSLNGGTAAGGFADNLSLVLTAPPTK